MEPECFYSLSMLSVPQTLGSFSTEIEKLGNLNFVYDIMLTNIPLFIKNIQ